MTLMAEDTGVFKRLEEFVSAELASRGHTGSSVSVVKKNEIVWAKGFGHSNAEAGTPATPDTVYRCASVTKPVVTFGLLQLMEKGKFHLDDPVNHHLDVKIRTEFEEQPTIRDLLTHNSGMPTRVPPIFLEKDEAPNLRDYIRDAARTVRPPRESWAYCNTGFAIVGHLIELFSGLPYDEYLRRNVLGPLEMDSSDFELTPKLRGRLAQGYKRAGGPDKPLQPVEPYVLGMRPEDPAGSMFSTVMDLAKFVVANMNGGAYKGKRVLGEETVEKMHRLQAGSGGSRSGMALTWFRSIHDGHAMLSHTGGLPDYTNHVAFYPEEGVGICWLSNLQDGSGWRPPAPTALRIVARERPRVDPEAFQAVPENWRSLVGVYGDETRKSYVTVQNGFLLLDGALILDRVDRARYRVHGARSDGYELTFEYNEDGVAKQYDLGTAAIPRYVEEKIKVEEGADLTGTWRGEYHDSSGFHTVELAIDGPTSARATDTEGNWVALEEFRAEAGKVSGGARFTIPEEFARWGTEKEISVRFELAAVGGKLKGLIRSGVSALPLTLERTC